MNEWVSIDLALEVGLFAESVKIEGTPPLLEPNPPFSVPVIQERQVQELPLNGRNVQLATLTPGVSGAGSGMRGSHERNATRRPPPWHRVVREREQGARTTICTTASTTIPG